MKPSLTDSITRFSIDDQESRGLDYLLKWIQIEPDIRLSEGTGEQLHNIIKILGPFIIRCDYLKSNYGSPSSGDAYCDRQLLPNF